MLSHHQLTQLQQHGIVHPNPYVSTQHHKYGVSQRSKQPAPAVVVEGASQLPEGQRPTQQSLGGARSYAAVGSGGWNSTRRGYGVGGAQQQEVCVKYRTVLLRKWSTKDTEGCTVVVKHEQSVHVEMFLLGQRVSEKYCRQYKPHQLHHSTAESGDESWCWLDKRSV